MMLDERALATVTDYEEMIAAIRARMRELGITNETVDAITGLPAGYTGKLIAGNATKNMGRMSFGAILQALALRLIVVEDAAAAEKMRPRWAQRKKAAPLVAMARTPPRATWLFTPRSGRKAAKARAEKLSATERRAIGLNAITVRWRREREKESRRRAAARASG
jgi:hypothetical protein